MFMKCKFRKLQLLGSPSSDNRFQIPAQQNDRVVEHFEKVLKRKQNFGFFEMYFQVFHFFECRISRQNTRRAIFHERYIPDMAISEILLSGKLLFTTKVALYHFSPQTEQNCDGTAQILICFKKPNVGTTYKNECFPLRNHDFGVKQT